MRVAGSLISDNTPGKNAIINGCMRLAQRGTSFSGLTTSVYTLDRWRATCSNATATGTVTKDADAPTGLSNSLKLALSGVGTLTTNTYVAIEQFVEGYSFAPFAGAIGVLSFYVKSNKTGAYSLMLDNSTADRQYITTFNIDVAATWERKTILIPFNYTGGTWDYTNGRGVRIGIMLAVGTNYTQSNLGVWYDSSSSYKYGAVGNVNFLDNGSNYFMISGIQLEPGAIATDFERRDIGRELQLCQRYFCKTYAANTAPGTATDYGSISQCLASAGGYAIATFKYPVEMRASPVPTYYSTDGTSGKCYNAGSGTINAVNQVTPTTSSLAVRSDAGSANTWCYFHVVAEAEL